MEDSDSDGPCEAVFAVDESPNKAINLDVPATSGNEYLLRVRQEAMGCPRVVVADLDTKAFLPQQTVKVSEPGGLLPVPASFKAPMFWQRMQVSEFAALRQKLIQFKALMKQKKINIPEPNLPSANDADSWCRLCFGRLKLKSSSGAQKEASQGDTDRTEEGTPPLLHIIANMNQHQICSVLEYHINWLEATGFTSAQGRWFYALLANLQKPLCPEVCSWLRRLARLCSNIRASLDTVDEPILKELNLIICLVSRYFDQGDLADS